MTTRAQVALGALLHDVGRVAARAGESVPAAELARLRRAAGPAGDAVAHTAWVLERLLQAHELGFAVRYADPQGALDMAVAVARRVAAPAEATPAEPDEAARLRLEPAFARVRAEGEVPPREGVHLPLRLLSFRPADLDPAAGAGPSSEDVARSEYHHGIWEELEQGLASLPPDANRAVVAALGVLERVGSRVPAGAGAPVNDLSMFDHARVCAAIATALFVEVIEGHPENDRALVAAVEDATTPRLLWVEGELCGGFGVEADLSAAVGPGALTGRAVWDVLLVEAIVARILAALELPATSVLFQIGTRFQLLLPLSAGPRLEALLNEIDLALLELGGGRGRLARGALPVCLDDLGGRTFSERWVALAAAREESRQRPFADLLGRAHGHEALFTVGEQPRGACAVCGDDLSGAEPTCERCRRFESLGRAAARATAVARVPVAELAGADRRLREAGARSQGTLALGPLGTGYLLLGELPAKRVPETPGLEVLAAGAEPFRGLPVGRRVGIFPPPRRGGEAPCGSLAAVARGARCWGALVVALDELELFAERGFPEERRTLARSAGLLGASHQFFAGFASSLAVRDDAVHVVRAGGDSLWAIGPWDHLPGLALALRDALHRYVGSNSAVGLCAGVAVAAPAVPVGKVLGEARQALDRARALAHPDGRGGDAVTLFGTALAWPDAALAAELAQSLADVGERVRILLLHVLQVAAKQARGPAAPGDLNAVGADLERGRWVWRLVARLTEVARGAGPDAELILRLQRALVEDRWEGRRHERSLLEIAGIAVQWCRLLTDQGEQA